jgi:hypothetical protein
MCSAPILNSHANMLLSMLVGADRSHYLFSGEPPPEPDPTRVEIIDCYLRAFAPESDPSSPAPLLTEHSMNRYFPCSCSHSLPRVVKATRSGTGGPAPGAGCHRPKST